MATERDGRDVVTDEGPDCDCPNAPDAHLSTCWHLRAAWPVSPRQEAFDTPRRLWDKGRA